MKKMCCMVMAFCMLLSISVMFVSADNYLVEAKQEVIELWGEQ